MQQFAHHRDHGLHRLVARADEFVVKGFDVGLVLNGHQRGHVERGAQVAVADFADAPRAIDRATRLVGARIEPGLGDPLRSRKIVREHQELRQQAHRGSLGDAFGRDQVGELGGQGGHTTNELQAAVLDARDAPFQVMDIDLDVVGDRIGAIPGEFRRMSSAWCGR